MIEDFLRPPRGAGELIADAVRVLAVVGVGIAAIWWSPTDAGILALALPAVIAPRFLAVRPGFDIAFGTTVLIAAWSNVVDLYRTVPGWDLVVHFACTGLVAAMTLVALGRWHIVAPVGDLPRRAGLVLTPVIALAASAVWEMIEWLGFEFVSDEIFVTYTDTIGDMAAGGLGGLVAGCILAYVRVEREPSVRPAPQASATG